MVISKQLRLFFYKFLRLVRFILSIPFVIDTERANSGFYIRTELLFKGFWRSQRDYFNWWGKSTPYDFWGLLTGDAFIIGGLASVWGEQACCMYLWCQLIPLVTASLRRANDLHIHWIWLPLPALPFWLVLSFQVENLYLALSGCFLSLGLGGYWLYQSMMPGESKIE